MTRRHRLKSEDFPARLKGARLRAGLTQAALAQLAGYRTKQGISELERARVGCTALHCTKLARALNVTPVWLAFGRDAVAGGSSASEEGYGARLKAAREDAGLSMEALAELLGYAGSSAIADLEAERRGLDLGLAESAAKVLRVAPEWLAFGER